MLQDIERMHLPSIQPASQASPQPESDDDSDDDEVAICAEFC